MNFNNKMILAKLQPTVDTDPTPDGANACVTEDLDWTYYAGNDITRNRDRGYFGANSITKVVPHTEFGFSVELAQVAAAGDAPAFGPLLRACGFAETIDVGIDVEYTPVSDSFEMVTVYFIDDEEQEQKSLNCRGTFSIQMDAESLPRIQFSGFMGTYNRPTAAGVYTIDTSSWEDAVPVSKGNTVTLTVDGHSGCVNSFNVDINNTVNIHDEPNCAGTSISGREVTGQIVMKAPTLATKDLFAAVESHSGSVNTVAIAVEHGDNGIGGSTRPNLKIDMLQVQLNDIQRTDVRGELYYTIPFTALPTDAGNDEITLTF
jgi:hypothetical protein